MPVLLDFTIKSLKLATGVVRADSVPQDDTSVANRVLRKYVFKTPVVPLS